MSEIFEKVNENAARAAELKRQEYETSREQYKARKQEKRRRANMQMLTRLLVTFVLVTLLILAESFGLVATALVTPIVATALCYVAFWIGAWAQYSWCKGGLLE